MDITTSSLLTNKKLTLKERVLFQYLLDLSNNGEREIRPTYKQIQIDLGLSNYSISSLYKSLIEKKLIDCKSDNHGTYIKVYTLVHEPECEKEDVKTPDSDDVVLQNQSTAYQNKNTAFQNQSTALQNQNTKKKFLTPFIYIY